MRSLKAFGAALMAYAKANDLACVTLDVAGRASVSRKPKGGLIVWAEFSGARRIARMINRQRSASFADVKAAAKACRVRLIPHAEVVRRAEAAAK